MFSIDKTPTYYWPVKVQVPSDGGAFTTETFDAQFRRLKQSEIEALRAKHAGAEADDVGLAREIVVGWRGVTQGGAELPFSESAFAGLLEVTGVSTAVVLAWIDSLTGARRKN